VEFNNIIKIRVESFIKIKITYTIITLIFSSSF